MLPYKHKEGIVIPELYLAPIQIPKKSHTRNLDRLWPGRVYKKEQIQNYSSSHTLCHIGFRCSHASPFIRRFREAWKTHELYGSDLQQIKPPHEMDHYQVLLDAFNDLTRSNTQHATTQY